jgi:hypothetical protein
MSGQNLRLKSWLAVGALAWSPLVGPAWSAPAQQLGGSPSAADRRQKVAVLELHDAAAVGEVAARFLSERLRGAALQLPAQGWFVITRENLVALLPPGTRLADCLAECEVETGRNIGADVIVTGEIISLNGQLRATLNAHRVDTGQLLTQQVGAAEDLAGLEVALDQAGARLFSKLIGDDPATRGSGTLSVTGHKGLMVQVDGIAKGLLPLINSPISAGGHAVVVEGPCHRRWAQNVYIEAGKSQAINLNPPPLTAHVTFKVTDVDRQIVSASVTADGEPLGRSPGPLAVPVCAQSLTVQSLDSYTVYRVALDPAQLGLAPDGYVEVDVRLAPPPRPQEPVAQAPTPKAPGPKSPWSKPAQPKRRSSEDRPLRVLNLEDYPGVQAIGTVCGLFVLIGVIGLIAGANPSKDTTDGEASQALAMGGAFTGLGIAGLVGTFIYMRAERESTAGSSPVGPAPLSLPAWTPGLSLSLPF